ncbi:hypothetical protein Tco_0787692 [Tanacetum coccineum]
MCVQCRETAFEFIATPSELASDDVNILVTESERNRLNKALEDSAELRHGDLRELSAEEAWETIEIFSQGQKEWDKPFKAITEQELASLRAQANELLGNEKVWFEIPRCIAWDKVDNLSPQSTPQVFPSFEMVATAKNINNTAIRSILRAEKLTGSNFTNWYRNLRIVLGYEKKMKFVEQPVRLLDPETADPDTIDKYYESVNLEQVKYVSRLTKKLKKYNAYDMLKELKTMFEEQAKHELFETVKAF